MSQIQIHATCSRRTASHMRYFTLDMRQHVGFALEQGDQACVYTATCCSLKAKHTMVIFLHVVGECRHNRHSMTNTSSEHYLHLVEISEAQIMVTTALNMYRPQEAR